MKTTLTNNGIQSKPSILDSDLALDSVGSESCDNIDDVWDPGTVGDLLAGDQYRGMFRTSDWNGDA
jgi:hypothetical protein